MRQILIANGVKVLMFLIVFASCCSIAAGIRVTVWDDLCFFVRSLIWNETVDSLLMWFFMACDVNDGVLLLTLITFILCLPTQSKDWWTGLDRYCFRCNVCKAFRNATWPVLQFFFRICPMPNAVSAAVWIPSSASTPQVGFLSMTTSSTPEEKSKSQGRRRMLLEVPCSGVLLGSLARF